MSERERELEESKESTHLVQTGSISLIFGFCFKKDLIFHFEILSRWILPHHYPVPFSFSLKLVKEDDDDDFLLRRRLRVEIQHFQINIIIVTSPVQQKPTVSSNY